MKHGNGPRQRTVSFKVTDDMRRLLEVLAARFTLDRGKKHTLTDVVEEALRLLGKKAKIKE